MLRIIGTALLTAVLTSFFWIWFYGSVPGPAPTVARSGPVVTVQPANAPPVVVAEQVHGISHRREVREDVERQRQVLDRVEDPGEEELRKHHEREDLVRGALAREIREDDHAEGAAEQRDDEHRERHARELVGPHVDLQDETERDDAERLRQGDERLAEDFPEDDRVAGDRRDEDLLAEILLPIGEKRYEPERRRLPHGLGEHTGEYVIEEVEAAGLAAEARLKARAEDADEDQREREIGDHSLAVAQQLDEVAVRERQDGRGFTHLS